MARNKRQSVSDKTTNLTNSSGGQTTNAAKFPRSDQALRDWDLYRIRRDDTTQWREQRDRMRQFAFGQMWSHDEDSALFDRDQLDIVINMIRPLLRTAVSLQIANRPTGLIFGKNVNAQNVAAVLQDYLMWHWEESDGLVLAEKTVMRQNREGVGFYSLFMDKNLAFGKGELRFGALSYENVFVDRGAGGKWDWSDSSSFIVSELVRPDDFYNQNIKGVPRDESLYVAYDEIKWPGRSYESQERIIGKPQSMSEVPEHGTDYGNWLRPLDIYERVWIDLPVIKQRKTDKVLKVLEDGEEISARDKIFLVDDVSKLPSEIVADIPPEQQELLLMEMGEARVKRINFRKNISGKMIVPNSEEILPISDYPVIPVIDEDTDNTEPLGEVDGTYASNQLLNSAISLVLLNAAGASNKKTIIDTSRAGIKQDITELQKEWALPNAFIDMNVDPLTGKFPYQSEGPDPLNPAFFSLVQFFAQDIQFASSVSRLSTGDPSQAPNTAFQQDQLQKNTQDATRTRVNRHELAIQRLFNLNMQWGAAHYTFEVFKDIVGEEKEVREEGQSNTIPLTELEVEEAWIALQDAISYKTKFRIRLGSTVQSETLQEAQLLSQAAPGNPVLLKHVIQRMPTFRQSEKQEIIKDLDIVAQQQDQLRQADQTIKIMQGEMQRLNESEAALKKALTLNRFESKIKDSVKDAEISRERSESKNENSKKS